MQLTDFAFKTQPFEHQQTALLRSADKEYYAILMEMGTGKTKVIIDTAAYLYQQGKIDAMVVIAPNGVHRNWVANELPVHMPDHVDYIAHWYDAGASSKQKRAWEAVFKHSGLRVFCFNIESASNKRGQNELNLCVRNGRVLLVVDEAQRIKTPGAKRTQFIVNLRSHAEYRRILSGGLITQSPLDLYAPFKFLEPYITGYTTYTAFRSHYAEFEQRKTGKTDARGRPIMYDVVTAYKNIRELENRVSPHVFRVLKRDCLDLPDKVYRKVYVELTAEQKKLYAQMLDKSVAVLCEEYAADLPLELRGADNEQLMLFFATSKATAKNAMVKLLRLQQLMCGSIPDDEGRLQILQSNRITAMTDLIEDITGKVIIWARFRYDIALLSNALREQYGADSVVEFHGGVGKDHRIPNVERFQNDPACRFFIANQHSGGTGLTLTAASDVIYYSNDFSYEARMQSEDRAHRIGQKNNVTYHDIVATNTVDEKILQALLDKKTLADTFNWNAGISEDDEEGIEIAAAAARRMGIDFEADALD